MTWYIRFEMDATVYFLHFQIELVQLLDRKSFPGFTQIDSTEVSLPARSVRSYKLERCGLLKCAFFLLGGWWKTEILFIRTLFFPVTSSKQTTDRPEREVSATREELHKTHRYAFQFRVGKQSSSSTTVRAPQTKTAIILEMDRMETRDIIRKYF